MFWLPAVWAHIHSDGTPPTSRYSPLIAPVLAGDNPSRASMKISPGRRFSPPLFSSICPSQLRSPGGTSPALQNRLIDSLRAKGRRALCRLIPPPLLTKSGCLLRVSRAKTREDRQLPCPLLSSMGKPVVGLGAAPVLFGTICAAVVTTIVYVHYDQKSEKEVQ